MWFSSTVILQNLDFEVVDEKENTLYFCGPVIAERKYWIQLYGLNTIETAADKDRLMRRIFSAILTYLQDLGIR